MEKVSVLISVYNSDINRLKKVFESIENQTYQAVEIIVVNDGSTSQKLNNWLENLNNKGKIKLVVNHENKGLIYSLNKGLQYCEGKYIARFDDDDISFTNRLEKQVKCLENNRNIVAVGGWANIVNDYDKIMCIKKYPNSSDICSKVAFRSPISHSLLLIKSDIIKKIGGYDEYYKGAEDYALFLKLIQRGYQLDNLQEVLGNQKFLYTDAIKRNRRTRLSVLIAKTKYFNFRKPLMSLIGILFGLVWYICPQPIINKIYIKDINEGVLYK